MKQRIIAACDLTLRYASRTTTLIFLAFIALFFFRLIGKAPSQEALTVTEAAVAFAFTLTCVFMGWAAGREGAGAAKCRTVLHIKLATEEELQAFKSALGIPAAKQEAQG